MTEWVAPGRGANLSALGMPLLEYLVRVEAQDGIKATALAHPGGAPFSHQDAMRAAEAIRRVLAGEE
jgi:hypothetical protein